VEEKTSPLTAFKREFEQNRGKGREANKDRQNPIIVHLATYDGLLFPRRKNFSSIKWRGGSKQK
jgi:hypothetical protein